MSKQVLNEILEAIDNKSSELIVNMKEYHEKYNGYEVNYSNQFHGKFSNIVINIITHSTNLITGLPKSMEVNLSDLLDFNKELVKVNEKLNHYFVLYWGKSPNTPFLNKLDTDY